jgi:hypothetical protein
VKTEGAREAKTEGGRWRQQKGRERGDGDAMAVTESKHGGRKGRGRGREKASCDLKVELTK